MREAKTPDTTAHESALSNAAPPHRRGLLAALAAGAAVAPALAVHAADNGSDAALIELADGIMDLDRQINRLSEQEEALPLRNQRPFREKWIRPLSRRQNEARDELATLSATTMAGFRAKARVLQVYNNCSPGYAKPWEDDALGWSLANDLLGVPSIWREADEDDEDDEAGHEAS